MPQTLTTKHARYLPPGAKIRGNHMSDAIRVWFGYCESSVQPVGIVKQPGSYSADEEEVMGKIQALPESQVITRLGLNWAQAVGGCGGFCGAWFVSSTRKSFASALCIVFVTAWLKKQIVVIIQRGLLGFRHDESSQGPLDHMQDSS